MMSGKVVPDRKMTAGKMPDGKMTDKGKMEGKICRRQKAMWK